MSNRTWSHMWARWYLPIFQFRDVLLTLMYIDSFISLMSFWSSLPTILKFSQCSSMTCGVEMVIYWGRGLKVFFKPLSKCSCRLSYVFFFTFQPVPFVSVYDATLLSFMVFVFGCHQEVFGTPAPFKVYLYAMFPTYIFYAFTEAFCIWYHYILSFGVRNGTVACWFLLLLNGQEHWSCSLSCLSPSWIFASGQDFL